ncbi:MAG: Hcp family type VI secretion system effector, partial [Limisphaerales bacterium]
MAPKPLSSLRKCGLLLGLALVYSLPFLTVIGSTDIFMKVGTIKGETIDETYKDWINVQQSEFGVTRAMIDNPKSGTSPSRPAFTDFEIKKDTDSSSPLLLKEATIGGQPQTVELEYTVGTQVRERYYRVKLYEALVTSFSLTAGTSGRPTEKVGLNYSKMEMTYTQSTKGQPFFENSAWYDLTTDKGGLSNAANTAPTISSIGAVSTAEDTPVTVPFTIGDAETSASNLSLAAASSNPTIAPLS